MLHQRTWAEIDLDALTRNLAEVRTLAGPGVDTMLVLKADAYGHGAVPVAWHLMRQGVACFGVGDSSEALELRAAGITAPILILGAIVAGELEDVIRGGILVTVHSSDRVRALRRAAEKSPGRVGVHLKVDTGMGRLGCNPKRALGIAREIRRSRRLDLAGVCTHLASVGPNGHADTERQLERFRSVLGALAHGRLRRRPARARRRAPYARAVVAHADRLPEGPPARRAHRLRRHMDVAAA
jgi:alanine racemase